MSGSDNRWTETKKIRLTSLVRLGWSLDDMAEDLKCTPASVDQMMIKTGLATKSAFGRGRGAKFDTATTRYQIDPTRAAALYGDKAFKTAMLRARKKGTEKIMIGVLKDDTPLRPANIARPDAPGFGSPAGWCASLGSE